MKTKIIGSIFLLFFLSVGYAQHIELRTKTSDGTPIKQAELGKPFVLEVVIKNVQGISQPRIEGLHEFFYKALGYEEKRMNNVCTVKYTFIVRIDQVGTYTLGPAFVITGNNKTLKSDPIRIRVVEEQKKAKSKSEQKDERVFLRISIDNDTVVLGQKIKFTLRFYFRNGNINLESISEPKEDLKAFTFFTQQEPKHSKEKINGLTYNVTQWNWFATANKVGTFVIPAFGADYIEQTTSNHNIILASFFNSVGMRKRVYSNALKIKVNPLPQTNKHIDGIGEFVSFDAKLDPVAAREGEGMVLTLQLSAKDSVDGVSIPDLQGMPPSFRFYPSKTEKTTGTPLPTLKAEYIVQGFKRGEWEIPAQTFTFYDTKNNSYRSLETNPIMLTILSNGQETKKGVSAALLTQPEQAVDGSQDKLLPLNNFDLWYANKEGGLPWWLFFILLLIPLVSILSYITYQLSRGAFKKYHQYVLKRFAFMRAKEMLAESNSKQTTEQLYPIFIQLLARRVQEIPSRITEEKIVVIMRNAGCSLDEIKSFSIFFGNITAAAFSQHDKTKNKQLFEQAKAWLEFFAQKDIS